MKVMKFSSVSRSHLTDSIKGMRGDMSGAKYSVLFLRPIIRGLLLTVAAGERIPLKFVRVVLGGCLKVGALKTVVYTIPSKAEGLRVQHSDVILGEPGVGKGQAYQ